jgi:hypothetical protein
VKLNRRDAPFSFTTSTATATSPVFVSAGIATVIVNVPWSVTVAVPHAAPAIHDLAVVVARTAEPEISAEPVEEITKRPDESTTDDVPTAEVTVTVATPSEREIDPGLVVGGVFTGVGLTGVSFGSFGSSKQFAHGGVPVGPVDGPVNVAVVWFAVAVAPAPIMLFA